MLKTIALVILATGAPACGGASDPSEDLVGRWDLHDDETGELEAIYAFDDDGTYRYREYGEAPESHAGTYETDGGLLLFDGTDDAGTHLNAEVSYFADDERFLLGALLPDGEVDGPVGAWSGSIRVESEGELTVDSETTYRLEANGTAVVTARDQDENRTIDDATWEEEAGEIVVSFTLESIDFHIHMVLIEGAAMGSPIFERAAEGS